MRWRGQLHKSEGKGGGPGDMGHLLGSTWHVPNDEVVVIAVCYPKTMSEIVAFCRMSTNFIDFRSSSLSRRGWTPIVPESG